MQDASNAIAIPRHPYFYALNWLSVASGVAWLAACPMRAVDNDPGITTWVYSIFIPPLAAAVTISNIYIVIAFVRSIRDLSKRQAPERRFPISSFVALVLTAVWMIPAIMMDPGSGSSDPSIGPTIYHDGAAIYTASILLGLLALVLRMKRVSNRVIRYIERKQLAPLLFVAGVTLLTLFVLSLCAHSVEDTRAWHGWRSGFHVWKNGLLRPMLFDLDKYRYWEPIIDATDVVGWVTLLSWMNWLLLAALLFALLGHGKRWLNVSLLSGALLAFHGISYHNRFDYELRAGYWLWLFVWVAAAVLLNVLPHRSKLDESTSS